MIFDQNQWKTKEINGFPLFFIDFDKKSRKSRMFREKKFFILGFEKRKNNFRSWKKKLGYSFDVKNCYLSIYEVSNVFWTL